MWFTPYSSKLMQGERFHSFLPFAAWGTVRVAYSSRDKAERINSSQPCFLCYVVLSFRGAECPMNHGSNWLKKPQPFNKKQIFFHVSSKFLFHMEVWDTNYSVKLRKRSYSCCLGVSQRESCSECAPPLFFWPKGLLCGLNGSTKQTTPPPFYYTCYLLGFPWRKLKNSFPMSHWPSDCFFKYKLSLSWSVWNSLLIFCSLRATRLHL